MAAVERPHRGAHSVAGPGARDRMAGVPAPDSDGPAPVAPAAAEPGARTAAPELTGAARAAADASRTMFRYANRLGMVPFHRAGLAAWLGNPLTGWQCLLTTIGRRSGLPRHTPLGYIVMDGAAWVLAGYGPSTLWYRNLLDDPRVSLLLPGRPPIDALAAAADDPSVRARVIPPLCRSMSLPGATIGCFPPTSPDARILDCVSWVPLVRIDPADGSRLVAGPDDPGGLGWTWRQAVALAVSVAAARALVGVLRVRRRSVRS